MRNVRIILLFIYKRLQTNVNENKPFPTKREAYRNNKGEKITDTHWHNIIAWGKTAELVENYVPKGKEIGVEGKLTTRSYEDKEGIKRYITEVVCNELLLLGK